MGLRLRDVGSSPRFTWADLLDYVIHGNQDTALALQRYGDAVLWRVTDHLLAAVLDALHGANWQRGGGKGQRPKPIKRPGVDDGSKSLGRGAVPIRDFERWWNGE